MALKDGELKKAPREEVDLKIELGECVSVKYGFMLKVPIKEKTPDEAALDKAEIKTAFTKYFMLEDYF